MDPDPVIGRGITITRSFSFSIIIYLAQIPGYFSAAWCNERFDRRRTIAIYLIGSAVSAFLLSQVESSSAIVAAGAVLSFFLNGVYAGLYAYTPRSFRPGCGPRAPACRARSGGSAALRHRRSSVSSPPPWGLPESSP